MPSHPDLNLTKLPLTDNKGDDLKDAAERGLTGADLANAVKAVDEVTPSDIGTNTNTQANQPLLTRKASGLKPERIEWLWRDRLAKGKLTLLAADPGCGKSTLTAEIAARVTTGAEWPDGAEGAPPGRVLMLNLEDGVEDTTLPRLLAAGADLERVEFIDGVGDSAGAAGLNTTLIAEAVTQWAEAAGADGAPLLMVLDPISALLGGRDGNNGSEVREALQPLLDLGARHGVCTLAVKHLNKAAGSMASLYRIAGSIDFAATARVVLGIARQVGEVRGGGEGTPSDTNINTSTPTAERRILAPVKSNLGDDQRGAAYVIEGAELQLDDGVLETTRIRWLPEEVTRADLERAMASAGRPRKAVKGKERKLVPTRYIDFNLPEDRLWEAVRRSPGRKLSLARDMLQWRVPGLDSMEALRDALKQLEKHGKAIPVKDLNGEPVKPEKWWFEC